MRAAPAGQTDTTPRFVSHPSRRPPAHHLCIYSEKEVQYLGRQLLCERLLAFDHGLRRGHGVCLRCPRRVNGAQAVRQLRLCRREGTLDELARPHLCQPACPG